MHINYKTQSPTQGKWFPYNRMCWSVLCKPIYFFKQMSFLRREWLCQLFRASHVIYSKAANTNRVEHHIQMIHICDRYQSACHNRDISCWCLQWHFWSLCIDQAFAIWSIRHSIRLPAARFQLHFGVPKNFKRYGFKYHLDADDNQVCMTTRKDNMDEAVQRMEDFGADISTWMENNLLITLKLNNILLVSRLGPFIENL